MKVIKVEDVKKSYNKTLILKDINFSVSAGCICGFIGPNGAGKTTTMNIIAGYLKADSGEATVLNQTVSFKQPPTGIRFIEDVPEFYNYLTIDEYLNFIKDLNKLESKDVVAILDLIGLKNAKEKRISTLSRGMRQRLAIGAAILPKPEVLLCDEPFSALDPVGRKEIFDIFKKLKGEITILFSTHILEDVEKICDQIVLINEGKIILDDSLNNILKDTLGEYLEVVFKKRADKDLFLKDFKPLSFKSNTVKLEKTEMLKVIKWCAKHKIEPIGITKVRGTLESVFLKEVGFNE